MCHCIWIIQDRLYESDFDRFMMLEQEVDHKDEVIGENLNE